MSDNQPKPLMLMFTIGPVQSFIEAARKTEDLWMGSYILSYLVATAMKEIQDEGVEIIYPAIGSECPFDFWERWDFRTPSFPNLFLAIGDKISKNKLAERAANAQSSVKTEFKRMAECAVDAAFKDWRGTYAECVFNRQISDFFDVYWVISEKTSSNYGEWYDYTAGSLAAIKNCRAFAQTKEFGRKCSLDGEREILHKKESEDERENIQKAMEWWGDFAKREPKSCRPKEALCAVSLTKRMGRHYLKNESVFKSKFDKAFSTNFLSFPSTSEVATSSFKEGLLGKPCALGDYAEFVKEVKRLRDLRGKLANIPYISPLPKIGDCLSPNIDGEWLYEETWNDSYLSRYYNIETSEQENRDRIECCKRLRRRIVNSFQEDPGTYYAAIALDADKMGEVNRKAKDREQHKEYSRLLIEYTEKAREIVEQEYLGKLTYAGGDDLLALANLKDLLPMLKKLRKKFPKFTGASAGVCIAHNKMPLSDVLRHARRMEQKAKAKDGGDRDAFAIALYKHSGNVSEVVTKWGYNDASVLAIATGLTQLLKDDEVSKSFLYTFRDAFKKLIVNDTKLSRKLPSILVNKEFNRLIERAHKAKGTEFGKANQEIISNTIKLLPIIKPVPSRFANFLSFLEIVSFIAREAK